MATCRDTITRALQLSGVVALGRDPRASESLLGLETLQGMYDQWVASGMFGQLTDKRVTANYTASEWERVIAPTVITVTKPTVITRENSRAPYELACIVTILNEAQTNYIWTKGAWTSLTGLTLDSEAPLSSYNSIGFSALLATKIAETFGREIKPSLLRQARGFQGMIGRKFGSTQPTREVVYY